MCTELSVKTMNAQYFYPAVAGTFLAALTFRFTPTSVSQHQPDRAPAIGDTTWVVAEADSDAYRQKSMQEIEAYALTLRSMTARSELPEFAARDYLHTRLEALREHVD